MLACALVAGGHAATAAAGQAEELQPAEFRVAFTLTDERIDESSGLVDGGDLMHTVNDSGDEPVLYTVEKATGATVATTTYSSDDVADVEALAPGPGDDVWVADIGDNNRFRSYVGVYRVPGFDGAPRDRTVAAEQFRLVYPGAPHDAETLLAHPRTGRLYLVSKSVRGGTVYAAPRSLEADDTNPMSILAEVPGVITDGTFLADGRHVLLRSYGAAAVYTFPDFSLVGRFRLPAQEQGEGVAVGADGAVYLSTEGERSDVLQGELPDAVTRALSGSASPAAPDTGPSDTAPAVDREEPGDGNDSAWYAAAAVSVLVGALVLVRLFRPRIRRTP